MTLPLRPRSAEGEPSSRPDPLGAPDRASRDAVRAALRDPERLRALDATTLLDQSRGDDRTADAAGGDDALSRVARLAARILSAPVAQVNLVTADAQIPHAAYVDPALAAGDPTAWRGPVTLAASLCQFVVADGRPFVVEDARVDPRARDSEAVTRAGLVGYCSVPLRVPALRDGASDPVIGSVCVVDFAPRQWTAADVAALEDLAVIAGTEVARATAERRERALADAMPHIVWTVAPDGRTTSTNRRWREYTGQSADTARAGETDAYVHPDDLAVVSAAWRRRLPGGADEGRDFTFEYRLRRADGSYRWHLGRAVAERDAQGAIVRWVGTGTDVDDQKRHETALAEANEQLAAANGQLQEQQLELELSNQQLQEQAGELEAQTEELLATAADLARETEAARTAGRAAEAERARATEANQAKSQFLANMSHELRTPLNAIGGYVQLLELGLHGPVTGGQQTALGRVQKAQQHLLALINDILNYAKLEGGRVEYDLREVDVRDVVADVTPLVEPQLAAKGLTFEVRLPLEACVVHADREKLGQVLVNLLSNAAKFTDARHPATGAPGRVTVELMARADEPHAANTVYLRVADTGRGIPREKQESIFEPFVQVRTGYAQATEGTGLGLAISRDLARGMGGDLRVRSTEGVGSTFTVTLRRG